MNLHLGHHFFGAGNAGDDFMLAGFLARVPARWQGRLTCAVPHDREALARAFPEVTWLSYERAERRRAIAESHAWLGLGGSPFQSAVSRWFIDHLMEEAAMCRAADKPMFFLGVGGQDPGAYDLPETRSIVEQAERIWTRDDGTAAALRETFGLKNVHATADLAHIFFAAHPPPPAQAGRLTAALNFDYHGWPALPRALRALARLPAEERVWAAQETRPLPGAEKWLFNQIPEDLRRAWRLQPVEGSSAAAAIASWPSGQWQVSSRYHATLAAAWSGSRTVVLATNDKLRAAAAETGYPLLEPHGPVEDLPALLEDAAPPFPARLQSQAKLAAEGCNEFFAAI